VRELSLIDENVSSRYKKRVLKLCEDISDGHGIIAACLYGPRVYGYTDDKLDINVLLVLREYRPRITGCYQPLHGAFILVTDQDAFEKDVKDGWLGEIVANTIITPFEPLINGMYLRRQESKLKRRIVCELLRNLVTGFQEISNYHNNHSNYYQYP